MNILLIMIPISLSLGIFFLFSFILASKKGQYDDLQTPAIRILEEDDLRKD